MSIDKGLTKVVAAETNISHIDGNEGILIYRGYSAKDLAIQYDFESVCYLLWYGKIPTEEEYESLNQTFKKNRELPDHVRDIIEHLPRNVDMMSVIRTSLSALGDETIQWPPTKEQAIKLTALVPTIIATRFRKLNGLEPVVPNEELGHVANYLYMLNGEKPMKAHVKALNAYTVLTMEHGMNASTFAARVIASTESEMVSAITGAVGAMKGPLHGGAPTEVTEMLNEIGSKENAKPWLRDRLESGKKLMGFGHRVYKTQDPRAEALKEVTRNLTVDDHWLDLANYVEDLAIELLEEYKPGRKLYTNVEFYAAAVLRAVEMPSELFTPTFTASRVVGWTANVIEQAEDNRIYRPQSKYVGKMPSHLVDQ
ncbi:citrate synthase/methylcitrate synthase [Halalkalibacillus halophilus]|uniref:citrate synthase/methylcitrate synthase n=1 Tax=Halalkalibacillus halophilus TaxID=392827 RepID=UPI00040E1D4F|nr:citrate synthase/methylcitrate synthase [Halalkalibacillus halophilus]